MGNFYSAHTLGLLRECDRCFYIKAVEGRDRPEGPTASITFKFDKLLKDLFDEHRKDGTESPHLLGTGLAVYPDQKKVNYFRKGIKFTGNQDTIFGKLDDAVLRDGKAETLDFKTRYGPSKADYVEYYRTALNLYNYLLGTTLGRENVGDTAHLLVAWPTLITPTSMEYKTEHISVSTSRDYVHDLMTRAVAISALKSPPKPGKDCAWCVDRGYAVRQWRREEATKTKETAQNDEGKDANEQKVTDKDANARNSPDEKPNAGKGTSDAQ